MIAVESRAPARPVQRVRWFVDLHFRQKWQLVWPHLARLPRRPLRLLDAGCGDGRWSVEIGLRRPQWTITGLDCDRALIDSADLLSRSWDTRNVDFVAGDFFAFSARRAFDVVLGVCSTHYGTTPDQTELLFGRFAEWLRPDGRLVLLLPRCREETSFVPRLRRPSWHAQFTAAALRRLCQTHHIQIDSLECGIGRVGALAKQLDWSGSGAAEPVKSTVRLIAQGLGTLDAYLPEPRSRSLMWMLCGRRAR